MVSVIDTKDAESPSPIVMMSTIDTMSLRGLDAPKDVTVSRTSRIHLAASV